ncbi:MAG: hypothetical protein QNJ69_09010 [Gammaproteobacteria bacterium]|nr:hypothetical protein [Gammaproteobacteria bacterium]
MKQKIIWAALGSILLSGCAMSTPSNQPNQQVDDIVMDRNYHVVVTHAIMNNDSDDRELFWNHVEAVEASLASSPGIVNFSKRVKLFSNEAWTLTVWEDEDAIDAFRSNASHGRAIAAADQVLIDARFARFMVRGEELPVSWDLAINQLERQHRSYRSTAGG